MQRTCWIALEKDSTSRTKSVWLTRRPRLQKRLQPRFCAFSGVSISLPAYVSIGLYTELTYKLLPLSALTAPRGRFPLDPLQRRARTVKATSVRQVGILTWTPSPNSIRLRRRSIR